MSDATPSEATVATTLRAVSDGVLDDLNTLARLETAKRRLKPSDPRRVSISEEIERLAGRLLGASTEQLALSEEALVASRHANGAAFPADAPAIEATPPRPVRAILDAWRDAERRLAALGDPDLPEAKALVAEIDRLRAEYRANR